MTEKLRVGVIFGGRSGEHEVSLVSAKGVMNAIDKDKYEVVPIGITKEGHWLASGDPLKALSSGVTAESRPAALLAEPSQQGLMRLEEQQHGLGLRAVRESWLDVVFPILHGPYGEDGTVQGLLELAGIPYVGAGVMASAVGMDKSIFKAVMRAHSIPVVRDLLVKRRTWEGESEQTIARVESEIGYPGVVKPANLGSSVGISKARSRSELQAAMDDAARYDRKLIVEVAIDAREIEVSVMGNDDPVASVPGEIVPCNEFYDYAAKYVDDRSELLIPAPIPDETSALVRRMAVDAYLAIDCAGLARADFLMDRGTGQVYVNEVNTIPGFTETSLLPKAAANSGMKFSVLCDRIMNMACTDGNRLSAGERVVRPA